MNGKPFAIIGVETTGMNPLRDRVIEVAVIRNDGKEVFSTLVSPGRFVPPVITSLTGITDVSCKGFPGNGRGSSVCDISLQVSSL